MIRASLLPLTVALLTACGATPTAPPDAAPSTDAPAAPDVATRDAPSTPDVAPVVDAPRASDAPSPDIADAAVSDVVDAAALDVITADVTDAAIAVDAPRRSFAEIYETILRPRCSECHGADRTGSAFVMRDAMGAYRALVNVPVLSRWIEICDYTDRLTSRASYRVRPGDPAASLLYFLPECYVRDAQHMRLTPEEREVIRGWILRGAPEMEL